MTDQPVIFEQVPLDAETYTAIGRLIRSAAEIEDLVTLAIGEFIGLDEGGTGILLGRSAISARVNILQALAELQGRRNEDVFRWLLGENLKRLLACRNVVAHGAYLGVDPGGNLAFQTSKFLEPESGQPVRQIDCYNTETIATIATKAEQAIALIERDLQLGTLRQTRAGQSVRPHRTGQNHQKSNAKPNCTS